ncbi:MAG TPA: NUDIX hydrolase [Rhabdaerophilum sp.]|nr:NUDIX hydrolase [Rhabdaerophilum sp.]
MSDISTGKPVLAASIAVFREGRVLLARRAKAPGFGLYSLPGGRVEPGETMQEAVLRELREEVGLSATITGFVDHVEHIEHGEDGALRAHAVIVAFAGEWLGGEPELSDEVSDIRWVDPLVPDDLPMTRRLPEILAKASTLHTGKTGS